LQARRHRAGRATRRAGLSREFRLRRQCPHVDVVVASGRPPSLPQPGPQSTPAASTYALTMLKKLRSLGDKKNLNDRRSPMRKFAAILAAAATLCTFPAMSHAQTVLKASHQFPGGKGDARDEMVQIIAREAKAANVGLEIQVYPGASLFK